MAKLTVSDFVKLARAEGLGDLLARELRDCDVRVSRDERASWSRTLVSLARALDTEELARHWIVLECPLPASGSRVDVVLVGSRDNRPAAVVIELKEWDFCRATAPEMVSLAGSQERLHPCAQAEGYADYLSHMSKACVDRGADVVACVYMPRLVEPDLLAEGTDATSAAENTALVRRVPAFTAKTEPALLSFIRRHAPDLGDASFADDLSCPELRGAPPDSLRDIANDHRTPWALVDRQREAVAKIDAVIRDIKADPDQRRVLLVVGPPGSGKTVVAITALLRAVGKHEVRESVVTTTSSALRDSIAGELSLARGERPKPARKLGAKPVLRATDLKVTPTRGWKSVERSRSSRPSDAAWQRYCRDWRSRFPARLPPAVDFLVCDEAQGLIDPLAPRVPGSPALSWKEPFGPQAWHLMMAARCSLFLMDEAQGYRQIGTTSEADVRRIA